MHRVNAGLLIGLAILVVGGIAWGAQQPDQGVSRASSKAGVHASAAARGPRGPRGFRGRRGPQGPQGPAGVKGDQGPQGPAGQQGAQGAPGDKGDKGDQGIQGIQGIQGPPGVPSSTVKTTPLSVPAGQFAEATATCSDAAAPHILGGGYSATDLAYANVTVVVNAPSGNGWRVRVGANNAGTQSFTVYAVCG